MLEFKQVNAGYGPIKVLHEVDLIIHAHEIVTLIGANGAGKSTLLMSLFGQPRISQGEILLNSVPVSKLSAHKIARLGVALVPEGRRIFPALSIEDNLYLGNYRLSKNQLQEPLEKIYSQFPILKERRKQRAGTLSGGEQQMLAIGRALMSSPKLLLLDEPSLGLAPKVVVQIFEILKTIAKQGTTLFLVEQNVNYAMQLAHRYYVLGNGRIQAQGVSSEFLQNKDLVKMYLGGF